jgi:hypothetical protein
LDVEISLNVEVEFLVELSLGWLFWILVNIDEVPLLVDSSVLVVYLNVSVFSINISLDIKYLSVLINHEWRTPSEHLPPSGFDRRSASEVA